MRAGNIRHMAVLPRSIKLARPQTARYLQSLRSEPAIGFESPRISRKGAKALRNTNPFTTKNTKITKEERDLLPPFQQHFVSFVSFVVQFIALLSAFA